MATKELVISVVSLIALSSTCPVQGEELLNYATLGSGKSCKRGIWNKNKKIAQAQSDNDSDMMDYYNRKKNEQQEYYRRQMQQSDQGSGYNRSGGYYYGPSEGGCGEGTCNG